MGSGGADEGSDDELNFFLLNGSKVIFIIVKIKF
jgi:hypothetical protein